MRTHAENILAVIRSGSKRLHIAASQLFWHNLIQLHPMDHILEHFRKTDAFLEGHFVLSSGLHSSGYLQCALALQKAADAADFGKMIADRFRGTEISTVASPAIGGLIIGYTVALSMGGRFIWTERR